jgi:hypothetical protein
LVVVTSKMTGLVWFAGNRRLAGGRASSEFT